MLSPEGTVSVSGTEGKTIRLTEYRRWNNRGPLPMRVWLRQEGQRGDPFRLAGWEGRLYREWTPEG